MTKLDHCNIRTFDLEATVDFYTDVVELKDGDFPGSRSMGAFLYDASDRPVLHVKAIDPKNPELDLSTMTGTGTIDHIAFECTDYDVMEKKLQGRGLKYTTNDVPSINLRQLFVNDPNGVTLELNFR
jgi:catechol 2,3-dioxygenase-like lactoylglutathione lyase family enzyme